MNIDLATEKMKAYCAYQERCHKEVKEKLFKLEVYGDAADEIIITLIQENFLNEERYAEAYCSGKFRIKKWGRNKIKINLKQKGISDYCIKKGMKEIDESEYLETISYWINRLNDKYMGYSDYDKKGKIAQYLMQKGFESNLVWEQLND